MRRTLLAALTALLVCAPAAQADGGHGGGELREYAKGTWASFEAMTDARSGLPADILNADGTTSVQTSTTNIGAYMWSAVAAEELGFIRKHELVARLSKTLSTLEGMERHAPTGQYFNWYDHHTGAKLTVWPPTGAPLTPILSSVDNGWLATGLKIVENTVPQLSRRAGKLYDSMNFGFYYRPDANRILFHFEPDDPAGRRAVTTPSSARAGSPTTSASPRADPGQGVLRAQPVVAGHVRRGVDGDQAGRWVQGRTSACGCSRARCPTRACRSSRPGAARCSRR